MRKFVVRWAGDQDFNAIKAFRGEAAAKSPNVFPRTEGVLRKSVGRGLALVVENGEGLKGLTVIYPIEVKDARNMAEVADTVLTEDARGFGLLPLMVSAAWRRANEKADIRTVLEINTGIATVGETQKWGWNGAPTPQRIADALDETRDWVDARNLKGWKAQRAIDEGLVMPPLAQRFLFEATPHAKQIMTAKFDSFQAQRHLTHCSDTGVVIPFCMRGLRN